MTAKHVYELHCDAPDCDRTFLAGLKTAGETRVRARREEGWSHGLQPPNPHKGGPAKSFDYCDEHAHLIGDLRPKTLPEHARPVDDDVSRETEIAR